MERQLYLVNTKNDNDIKYPIESVEEALILAHRINDIRKRKNIEDECDLNLYYRNKSLTSYTLTLYEFPDGQTFSKLLENTELRYNLVIKNDNNKIIDYNHRILTFSKEDNKSYKAEYIREWCEYHILMNSKEYYSLACSIYKDYWQKTAISSRTPNPEAYYKVRPNLINDTPAFVLLRDIKRSPRVEGTI